MTLILSSLHFTNEYIVQGISHTIKNLLGNEGQVQA